MTSSMRSNSSVNTELTLTMFSWRWLPVAQRPSHWRAYVNRRTRGALTVGIANNRGTPILEESHHPIFLDTGPEPIAGSTRLKAGTAQKITLNGLSTLLMILLGRVYRGLMVDVRASNEKLVRRSEDMLVQLTGCSQGDARNALNSASGSVKLAVLLLHGCNLKLAEDLLDRAKGHLGKALDLSDYPD